MKIGVFSVLFGQKPFEETLDSLVELGLEAVEIGTGGYAGNAHCDPVRLLGNDTKLRAFRAAVEQRGLVISALSCHGNPLHPRTSIARTHHLAFEQTVRLASRLGVKTVVTFSGCPGGDPRAAQPNWIVAPWPPEFADALEWQWTEKVIPYWRNAVRLCRTAGVRVAIEMHPNFVAYNPESLQRLRAVAPDLIGCNFDPSHLFWQGIDPVAAIKTVGDGIFHVHVKDCQLDAANIAANGVLDAKRYARALERSWIFRTAGYGHDAGVWKAMVSALRLVGYDHVLSIAHEDSLMPGDEGLRKAIAFLQAIVIREAPAR